MTTYTRKETPRGYLLFKDGRLWGSFRYSSPITRDGALFYEWCNMQSGYTCGRWYRSEDLA